MKPLFWTLMTITIALVFEGCGKSDGTTTVKLANAAFSDNVPAGVDATPSPTPAVTDFKLCIARVRIETENGDAVAVPDPSASPSPSPSAAPGATAEDDDGFFTFRPGLLDLSNGLAQDWGNVTLPAGARISRIRIKVRKDKALCGVDYSMSYNGNTSDRDIEIHFRFNPTVSIDTATGRLSLKFASILAALGDGALNADELKTKCEGAEGGGEKHEQ